MKPGLHLAISRAGSMRKLAGILGISQQAISKWDDVPAHQLLAIERATGVPREMLRPELFDGMVRAQPALRRPSA